MTYIDIPWQPATVPEVNKMANEVVLNKQLNSIKTPLLSHSVTRR